MTVKKTRNALTALVAALCVAVGATGVASAHSPAQDKLTIHYTGDGFTGKIKSSKAKCLANRTVTVHGPHGQRLKDTTEDDGAWDTGNSGQAHGKYFATVNAKGNCLPLVSKTLHL